MILRSAADLQVAGADVTGPQRAPGELDVVAVTDEQDERPGPRRSLAAVGRTIVVIICSGRRCQRLIVWPDSRRRALAVRQGVSGWWLAKGSRFRSVSSMSRWSMRTVGILKLRKVGARKCQPRSKPSRATAGRGGCQQVVLIGMRHRRHGVLARGSGRLRFVGAVEAFAGCPPAQAAEEAGEPAVVPHLGGVVVGLDVVEGFAPGEGEGGDFGGEAAVFGPAVRDVFGVVEWRVAQVEPGHPGGEDVDVVDGWRLVVAPRCRLRPGLSGVDELAHDVVDGFDGPGLGVDEVAEGRELASEIGELVCCGHWPARRGSRRSRSARRTDHRRRRSSLGQLWSIEWVVDVVHRIGRQDLRFGFGRGGSVRRRFGVVSSRDVSRPVSGARSGPASIA